MADRIGCGALVMGILRAVVDLAGVRREIEWNFGDGLRGYFLGSSVVETMPEVGVGRCIDGGGGAQSRDRIELRDRSWCYLV